MPLLDYVGLFLCLGVFCSPFEDPHRNFKSEIMEIDDIILNAQVSLFIEACKKDNARAAFDLFDGNRGKISFVHGKAYDHALASLCSIDSETQMSAFQIVVKNGNDDLCNLFFTYKKQILFDFVNYQNGDGDTALHIAARNGNVYLVQELLRHGARKSIANKKGLWPCDVATHVQCQNLLMI